MFFFLQSHPDIIIKYKDIDLFKGKVQVKAFTCYEHLLDELIGDYNKARMDKKKLSDKAKEQVTDSTKALDCLKKYFLFLFQLDPRIRKMLF